MEGAAYGKNRAVINSRFLMEISLHGEPQCFAFIPLSPINSSRNYSSHPPLRHSLCGSSPSSFCPTACIPSKAPPLKLGSIPDVSSLFTSEGYHTATARLFVLHYWQKRPVLIKYGLPSVEDVIGGDDLAALAMNEHVTSRMVRRRQRKDTDSNEDEKGRKRKKWQVHLGPFDEEDFEEWGDWGWTLLVNGLERHVKELAELRSRWFSFLPHCRLGDVMVSVAADGGGVGPHVDNFDVFLVQVSGRRRWRVGKNKLRAEEENCEEEEDLRVLKRPWRSGGIDQVVGPGDVLYVPARYPHWGEGVGDNCVTASVGFRGMSVLDIVSRYTDYVLRTDKELKNRFVSDNAKALNELVGEPGRIPSDAIQDAFQAFIDAVHNSVSFSRWYGSAVTEPFNQEAHYENDADLNDLALCDNVVESFVQNKALLASLDGVNWSYVSNDDLVTVWGDGIEFRNVPLAIGQRLAANAVLSFEDLRRGTNGLDIHLVRESLKLMVLHGLLFPMSADHTAAD